MVVVFTGMSGIEINDSIHNFINHNKDFRTRYSKNSPVLIKFEDKIQNAFHEENPLTKKSRSVWLNRILTKSYTKLEEYWDSAFNDVELEIENIKKSNPDRVIFLSIHACYFHYKTQEYISLIDIKKLASLNPEFFVTLIDDIYDIHQRLTKLGGIYHDEKFPTKTGMILRYLRLLDWRAKETMMSRFLAKQLGLKSFLFAVKHPYETLTNLIYEPDLPIAYLSHPISEVRRLEMQGKWDEADKIRSEITELSEYLTTGFTTFLPTSIDEFRIVNKKVILKDANGEPVEEKHFYSHLSQRWDRDNYLNPKNILYKNSEFHDENDLWEKYNPEMHDELEVDQVSNQLLTALADVISDQVSTRDYTLVEQSNVLIIYRPFFNGNPSGGVKEEFNYYQILQNDLKNPVKCFIYSPQLDIDNYYIKEFNTRIKGYIDSKDLKCKKVTNFVSISTEECGKLLEAIPNELVLLEVLEEVLNDHHIGIDNHEVKTPLNDNPFGAFKNTFITDFLDACAKVDLYKKVAIDFETKQLTVLEYYDKILSKS